MKKVTLTVAVTEVLKRFIASHRTFSAFEVTQDLRQQINDGLLEIQGLPTIANPKGTGASQLLTHQAVRLEVRDLVDGLLTPDYSKRNNRAVQGGTFLGYVSYIQPAAPLPALEPLLSTDLLATPFDTAEQAIAEAYVLHRHAEGTLPTLKAIQSRLKDIDVTCDEIASYFAGKGYLVVQPTDTTEAFREIQPKPTL